MDPISIGFTILQVAATLLKDTEMMDALFKSDQITDEQKEAIRSMRDSLEDKWNSLKPQK